MEKQIDHIAEIKQICDAKMQELGFIGNEAYETRLKKEYKDLQDWKDYANTNMAKILFEQKEKHLRNPASTNSSGSILLFLLGISLLDPIQSSIPQALIALAVGDTPDIDTDFDPNIKDWVKEQVIKIFGEQETCCIGSYQTYKTRAVIIDVSRALGLDVWEAMEVTKKMDPLARFEDEEGEEHKIDEMEWDEIIAIYPELKVYFNAHPDVRKHCEILRNQVKNMSAHAAGMIISNLNLQDKIPVVRDSKRNLIVSTWSEGQNTHELSEVGLVKFDILGLSNLTIISDCLKLIEQTKGHKITKADIPINNREAIKFGSKADLVGIFQFENPATKVMVDAIGMDSIFDISAVTSLLRPGPKDMEMHDVYAKRKNGAPYTIPECLKEVFVETYGVVVYQEQCFSYDVRVLTNNGEQMIGDLAIGKANADRVFCVDDKGRAIEKTFGGCYKSGRKPVVKLTLDNGSTLKCTNDQKIMTSNRGWVEAQHLMPEDDIVTIEDIKLS